MSASLIVRVLRSRVEPLTRGYATYKRPWQDDAAWRFLKQAPEPNVTPRPVRTAQEWVDDTPLPGEDFYYPKLKPEFPILTQAMFKMENPRKKKRSPGVHLPPKPLYRWDWRDLDRQTGGEYTHKPLSIKNLEGRHPTTGLKVNKHVRRPRTEFDYFVIDIYRYGPTDGYYEERILEVRKDPNRTCHIALCAGERGKRWLVATTSMVAGDIIRTTQHMPERPIVGAREGDAHPLGALAPETRCCSFESYPGEGMQMSTHAGATNTVVKQQGDYTVIQTPHRHLHAFKRECMAVVGQVSNVEWNDLEWRSANMHSRFGYKQSSGKWHRKDGYCGYKAKDRLNPPIAWHDKPLPERLPEPYRVTLTKYDVADGADRQPRLMYDEVPIKWMRGTQKKSRKRHQAQQNKRIEGLQ